MLLLKKPSTLQIQSFLEQQAHGPLSYPGVGLTASQPPAGYAVDHAGSGEERFLLELDERGAVWYDFLAFSRPQHPLAKLGYPFVRVVQKRFGRDSAAAMRRSVQHAAG